MDPKEQDNDLPSIEDAEKLLADTDSADLDPHEDDAFFLHILHPAATSDEEPDEDLKEHRVLSVQQRMKLSQRMKRLAPRMARLKKMKEGRMAPADRLQYRARKAALNSLRKRVAGTLGSKYSELSKQQKITVDSLVEKRFGNRLPSIVNRIAQRLMPSVRKKEMQRLEKVRTPVKEARLNSKLYGKRTSVDPSGGAGKPDDMLHRPVYPHTTKKQQIMPGVFITPKGPPDNLETQEVDADGDFDLRRTKRNKTEVLGADTLGAMTPIGNRRKDELKKEITEARKSNSGAGGDQVADRHITDHLERSVTDPDYVIPWTNAKPSTIKSEDARSALSAYAKMLKRSGPPSAKLEITKRYAHSPERLKATADALHQTLKEEAEPVSVMSLKKIKAKQPSGPDSIADTTYNNLRTGPGPGPGTLFPTVSETVMPNQLRAKLSRQRVPEGEKDDTPKPKKPKPNNNVAEQKIQRALQSKADYTGIPYETIFEVFTRGLEEGNTQDAFSRVNSFIAGGYAAELDADLYEGTVTYKRVHPKTGRVTYVTRRAPAKKGKKGKRLPRLPQLPVYEEGGAGEIGTPELVRKYSSETPGQEGGYSVAPYSAPQPWTPSDKSDTGKTPTQWKDVQRVLSGKK